MDHLTFNIPTVRDITPTHPLSRLVTFITHTVLNTILSYQSRVSPPHIRALLSSWRRHWKVMIWLLGHAVKSVENLLPRLFPFQPLYRVCWRHTCWYATVFPTKVIASYSSRHVWVCREVWVWAVTVCISVFLVRRMAREVHWLVRWIAYWTLFLAVAGVFALWALVGFATLSK